MEKLNVDIQARERVRQGLESDLEGLRRNLELLRSEVEASNQRIAEFERTIAAVTDRLPRT